MVRREAGLRAQRARVAPSSDTFPTCRIYAGDVVACAIAGVLAGSIAGVPFGHWFPFAFVVMVSVPVILHVRRKAQIGSPIIEQQWILESVSPIVKLMIPVSCVAVLLQPRLGVVAAGIVFGGLVLVGMTIGRTVATRWWWRKREKRVAVCGVADDALHVAERVANEGSCVVGLITYDEPTTDAAWPALGSWDELIDLYAQGKFDAVVFSIPKSSAVTLPLSITAASSAIPFRFVADGSAPEIANWPPSEPVLVRSSMGVVERTAKRVLDIAIAVIAIVASSPLFLVLAIVVPLDSPGPLLFRQLRMGKNGKLFTMLKFRTLHFGSEQYAISPKSEDDERITRIGRILRKISIDEIPQFLNVLRGEMSVIGPRPEMPFIVGTYGELERVRLAVKPGITGIWQISPCRGLPIHESIYYDLFYVERQSVLLDLIVTIQTAFLMCRGV